MDVVVRRRRCEGGRDYCILVQRSIKSGIGWEGNRKRALNQVQLHEAPVPIVWATDGRLVYSLGDLHVTSANHSAAINLMLVSQFYTHLLLSQHQATHSGNPQRCLPTPTSVARDRLML